jgi:alpha-L-arabinofuranosidase
MVDEHYYESTGWFMHHRDYYDNYPRTLAGGKPSPKVYLGEYAASTNVKRPNVETALAEAIYLTDVERNGNIVEMTSYAPMLSKDGHSNWNPDMIYFGNTSVRTTPAYDVQRLFSVYGGDRYISSKIEVQGSQSDTNAGNFELSHRLAASFVRDTKTGKRYLKLINALPVPLQLSIHGLSIPAGSQCEGFEGKPEEQRLQIITTEVQGNEMVLPAYSMRAIEINQ